MRHAITLTLVVALSTVLACENASDSSSDNDDDSGAGAATGTGGNNTGGSGGAGSGGDAPTGPTLPTPTGTCPELINGDVMFSPAGIAPRNVRIFMDPDAVASLDGPLMYYWHGTGSDPVQEPPYGLGEAQTWVVEAGGIIAAPYSDPAAGQWPWFLTTGGDNETDLVLADEILACAIEKVGIDTQRIHSIGMSAGGLQTTQMGYRRSNYLASVVTYSGGILGTPMVQNETNPFAAMIFHGGPNDIVVVNFKDLSETYLGDLQSRGHFAFICDHGGEHTIPTSQNDQQAVMSFFQAHPWQTTPSPYETDGLPAGFPSYCSL